MERVESLFSCSSPFELVKHVARLGEQSVCNILEVSYEEYDKYPRELKCLY